MSLSLFALSRFALGRFALGRFALGRFALDRFVLDRFVLFALLLSFFVGTTSTRADVVLPNVVGSHMVLQRDLPVPIWGFATAGEKVTISFAGQEVSATTASDGTWRVTLDSLTASSEGREMKIRGKNEITLENILVGEVWICSGQSNMEWRLTQIMKGGEEIKAANHPKIRLFDVPGHTVSPIPKRKGAGQWRVCSPRSVAGFSAVGYFFGRRLHRELDVPVGLVGSNWGGTRIEPWTTLEGFRSVPELEKEATSVAAYTARTRVGGGTPSAIYRSMVHPLTPFAMRGAIWYQGESNGSEGRSYYHKKHALVNGWRKAFDNDKLAFYWVQLANFQGENPDPVGGDGWAKVREAQLEALDIPETGMAVITDIGAANDIHPRNKQDVGKRLAQWALHQTYGKKDLVPSGPIYKSMKVEGDSIRLSFDHVGKGLMIGKKTGLEPTVEIKDGKLEHFSIAGEDMKFAWAEAVIDGETVVVRSPKVAKPAAVRYAYAMNPAKANLYNREGLPATAFRTDRWIGPSENISWLEVKGDKPPKSTPGSTTEIIFTNKRSQTVKVYWVSYVGDLKFYGTIEPGKERRQNTFAKAHWLITDENDKPLGYFRTTPKVGRAEIPKD